MSRRHILPAAAAALLPFLTGAPAIAQDAPSSGGPAPWELGFQAAATPVMERIDALHDGLLIVITAITVFVLALLLIVIFRFNEKRNPRPSKNSHNTLVEVVWTVVPVFILLGIAIPSFRLLYFADRAEEAEMTIKAIGRQWNWGYEYPDHGNFTFEAFLVPDEELAEGQLRLLSTDEPVVVPVETNIRLLTTASDVLHSWAVPSFGVKIDAVPGRTNESWFRVERPGRYYGQCSELCGIKHAFMPIVVEVVSEERFAQWLEEAKEQYGSVSAPISVAAVAQ